MTAARSMRSLAAALAIVVAAATLPAGPALAMCGGNIFMTCPPAAKPAVSPDKADAKREARRRTRLLAPKTAR